MSTISKFTQLSLKALFGFYQVVHRIVKCKKPHTIAEGLILPAVVDLIGTMIEGAAQKLKMVPLSDDIMCHRIDDIAQDIQDQMIDEMKQPEFGLQLDKATDGIPDLLCAVC